MVIFHVVRHWLTPWDRGFWLGVHGPHWEAKTTKQGIHNCRRSFLPFFCPHWSTTEIWHFLQFYFLQFYRQATDYTTAISICGNTNKNHSYIYMAIQLFRNPEISFVHITTLFLKFYLLLTDIESQRHRQREKQAPHREPDVWLYPRTPGSHLELKADT